MKPAIFCLSAIILTTSFASYATSSSDKKPYKLVVPFPAGGGADIIARTISDELARNLGQKIIVENRAGAGGSLGTEWALREKADGRTLIYVTNGTLCVNPVLYPKIGYDVNRDIEPVSRLTDIALVMAINPQKLPVRNLGDFLAYAQKSATALTFSSAGNGTSSHLAGVLLSQLTNVPFEHIPYRGGAASITDVLAGRIDFTIDVAPNVWPHVQAGRLLALGTGSKFNSNSLHSLKTIEEQGVKGYELFAWDGIAVKKGTPENVVKIIDAAIQKTLANKEVRERLLSRGANPVRATPEEFNTFVQSEQNKWRNIVKSSKTTLN